MRDARDKINGKGEIMNKHQKLEQQILSVWEFDKDIKSLTDSADWTSIDPIFMDRLLSIASVYEMRVERLWGVYEEALQEHYHYQKLLGDELYKKYENDLEEWANDEYDFQQKFKENHSCLDSAMERRAMFNGLLKTPVFPENQLDEYPNNSKDR